MLLQLKIQHKQNNYYRIARISFARFFFFCNKKFRNFLLQKNAPRGCAARGKKNPALQSARAQRLREGAIFFMHKKAISIKNHLKCEEK